MCPACLASAALLAAGATSAGGITALVAKRLQARRGAKKISAPPTKGDRDGTSARRVPS
jgi:hypothetical protein